jgi:hypothetical protein
VNVKRFLMIVVSGVLVAGVSFWGGDPLRAMPQAPSSSELAYQFVDTGGVWLSTAGSSVETPAITYTRIQPGLSGTTPSGFGIFGFRNSDGVLITETSVPASSLIQEGRTIAQYSVGIINTGIAFVNPNDQETTIDFYFTDIVRPEGERDFGADSLTLGPNQQMARFISEAPFDFETGVRATLTFSSSLPVAAIAVTESFNLRNETLYSTVPVADISGLPSTDTVYLPHFAESGNWSTDFSLINPTDETITGILGFVSTGRVNSVNREWDIPGLSTPVALNGATSQALYPYSIAPKGVVLYRTFGGLFLQTGSARALPNPDDGSAAPIVQVVFSALDPTNFSPLSQASFVGTSPGLAFRMYVEAGGELAAVGSIRSGIAVHNISLEYADVWTMLTDLNGTVVATGVIPIPPSGQRSLFLEEMFPDTTLPDSFKGVLRVATVDQQIAAIALRSRVNERGDVLITTTPPADESAAATGNEVFFPHLVDGGGWSTETVLYSGFPGQFASGHMRFFDTDGQPFEIPLQ